MKKFCVRVAVVAVWMALVAVLAMPIAAAQEEPPGGPDLVRFIVEFAEPPVVRLPNLPRDARQKLDVYAPMAVAHRARLTATHDAFRQWLAGISPDAVVDWTYDTAYNGAAVRVPGAIVERLREFAGVVNIFPQRKYELQMDSTPPLIGATDFWNEFGGIGSAGEGVKVAVVDTGIWIAHDFFNPAGFTMPAGYPRGETHLCTAKVIAARSFFRGDDPVNTAVDFADARDGHRHGTHCAGTIAGNPITINYGGASNLAISGVAPRAYLMAYKILYESQKGEASVYDGEAVAAMDWVVKDGADVVSNSWGHPMVFTVEHEPHVMAVENMIHAGLVVVYASGNSRSQGATSITAPAGSPNAISVAAASGSRIFGNRVEVTAPAGMPANLTAIPSLKGNFNPAIGADVGPAEVVEANDDGTAQVGNPLTGKIALIARSATNYATQISNAAAAGAIAAIVYNTSTPDDPLTMTGGAQSIPGVMISNANAQNLLAWMAANPGTNRVVIRAGIQPFTNGRTPFQMASFSSLGPAHNFGIKPDITAPGVAVLSSIHTGIDGLTNEYQELQGTSMACPHMAGVCALMKQKHPTWAPWQIKSAVMTTAGFTCKEPDGATDSSVISQGAGRVHAERCFDPGLWTRTPSHSFGILEPGATAAHTFAFHSATNIAESFTVTHTELVGDANLAVSVSAANFSLPGDGSTSLTLNVNVGAATAFGDYEGIIELAGSNGHTAHVVYWLRVAPAVSGTDFLLIDYDQNAGGVDVQGHYTAALTAMGAAFTVWDVAAQSRFPTFAEMRPHAHIIIFSGNYNGSANWNSAINAALQQYAFAGGNVAMFGHRLPVLFDTQNFGKLLQYRLGAAQSFNGAGMPNPTMTGAAAGPLAGLTFDIQPGAGDGLDFLADVRELAPEYIFLPNLCAASARAISPVNQNFTGALVLHRAAQQTLNDPDALPDVPYRMVMASFGIESINDDTGHDTRQEFFEAIANWLRESPSIAVNAQELGNLRARLTVTGAANALEFRYDFGDGSGFVKTASATVDHAFAAAGTYAVRVEMTTATGHVFVSAPVTVSVGVVADGGGNGGTKSGCAVGGDVAGIEWLAVLLLILLAVRRRLFGARAGASV